MLLLYYSVFWSGVNIYLSILPILLFYETFFKGFFNECRFMSFKKDKYCNEKEMEQQHHVHNILNINKKIRTNIDE